MAIRIIERNQPYWGGRSLANYLAKQIENIAEAIENIPSQFKGLSPSVRKDLVVDGRRKAQAIRNLQRWILTPGPLTYGDLLHRLTQDICLVADGRWFELPEAEFERRKPVWMILGGVVLGIILLGGAIAILAAKSKIGSTATVVATLLVALASGVFANSGLSLGVIEGSMDAGSKLTGK